MSGLDCRRIIAARDGPLNIRLNAISLMILVAPYPLQGACRFSSDVSVGIFHGVEERVLSGGRHRPNAPQRAGGTEPNVFFKIIKSSGEGWYRFGSSRSDFAPASKRRTLGYLHSDDPSKQREAVGRPPLSRSAQALHQRRTRHLSPDLRRYWLGAKLPPQQPAQNMRVFPRRRIEPLVPGR
jgi:hypothetical protein